MISVALPKGRLGDQVYSLFQQAGYPSDLFGDIGRKLVVENREAGVRYFLVKPSDVAIYVERGVADVGVVGKDILLETEPDVYELMDLGLGRCRVAIAAPNGYREDPGSTLRVATKYLNIAKKYFASQNRDIEIIKLNGSIELAPLLGLSDVILDIVETGSTLRENDMGVVKEIMDISARLIANKSGYKFKYGQLEDMASRLKEVLQP